MIGRCVKSSGGTGSGSLDSYVSVGILKQKARRSVAAAKFRELSWRFADPSGEIGTRKTFSREEGL
jgi:hypothetical protein